MIQLTILGLGTAALWLWADTGEGIYLVPYVACWGFVALWRFFDQWGARIIKERLNTKGATNEQDETDASRSAVVCAEAGDRGGGADRSELPPTLLAAHREILRLRGNADLRVRMLQDAQSRLTVFLYHIVQNMPRDRYCPKVRNDKLRCALDMIDPTHGMDRFSACMDCLLCNHGNLPQPGQHPYNGHDWSPTKEGDNHEEG